jgi:hypothetical protein
LLRRGIVALLLRLLCVALAALMLATVYESEPFDKHAMLASLRAVLGFPSVKIKSALYQQRTPFTQVLIYCLGLFAIGATVDETHILALLAVLPSPSVVYRQAYFDDGGVAWQV